MRFEIQDQGRRLPEGARKTLRGHADGIFYIPDCGVPIHPESAQRLAGLIPRHKAICFVPEIPIASELRFPKYPPILYWIPRYNLPQLSWWQRISGLPLSKRRITNVQIPQDVERITETGQPEQIHYFAEHFGAISQKPAQVSVVLSNVCNLKCVMCPYHSPVIRVTHHTDFFKKKIFMSWEMMDHIASECGQLGIYIKMGNIEEPLLHPRLVDFVHACRSRGTPGVHITTNGTLLTGDYSRRLLEAGVTSWNISIDAINADTYKTIRGFDLKQVEDNIYGLIDLRQKLDVLCTIRISFVKNAGISPDEMENFREKWIKVADGVILYNLAEYENGITRYKDIHCVAKDKMAQAGRRWPCLNPWQEMYILPDGRVYYCCETILRLAFDDQPSMGIFPLKSIKDIWLGKRFTQLRQHLITGELAAFPVCRDCKIWMASVTEEVKEKGLVVARNMITEIIDAERKN